MRSSRQFSRGRGVIDTRHSPTKSEDNRLKQIMPFDQYDGHDLRPNEDRSNSHGKEPSPIIINKDERISYKPPSSIHETVVHTLRKEKDNLTVALQNQREANMSMAKQVTQLSLRIQSLEDENVGLKDL